MGRSRADTRERTQQENGDSRQLALIAAAILAVPTPVTPAAIAALASALVGILPIAALVGSEAIADRIALEVARLVLGKVPDLGSQSPYMRLVAEEQLIYQAAFARAASKRLADAYHAGNIEEQQAAEARHFGAHLLRTERRLLKARSVDEAMSAYGEVVGWYSLVRPTSRPHHRVAHRHNWQPLLGSPLQTGGIPGELPHCLCEVGPPIEGARLLR